MEENTCTPLPDDIEDAKTDSKQAHLILNRMLDIVDSLCKKYDIDYWLDYTTLLGAIRYKGFVPGENKIHIGMLRPDYSFFSQICITELPGDIIFQKEEDNISEEKIWFIEGRLFDKKNRQQNKQKRSNENMEGGYDVGLYINFFVYDGDPLYENAVSSSFERRLSNARIHLRWEEIETFETAFFEGKEYCVPAGYHSYLQRCYGNYMEVTPFKERDSTTSVVPGQNLSGNFSRTKILFSIDNLYEGGAQKLLMDILKRMDYRKYQVDLFVLKKLGIYFTDIPAEVRWFTTLSTGESSDIYDIEIAFMEGSATQYIGKRESKAKKIAWVHSDLYNMHWTKVYFSSDAEEKGCYSNMNTVIFVSKDARHQFNKLYPDIPSKQDIIYNLIDKTEINRKASSYIVPKERFTICGLGRVVNEKGYARLIPIVHQLYKEGLSFELWIIGSGTQKQAVQSLIDEYSLNEVVFLKGFHKNPYPYLKNADVFISSSYTEGFPLVICEALCLEIPVIATECTGVNELLDDGKFGMLLEQNEVSIYNGLKEIITNSELREYYKKKAIERSEMFDVTKTMQHIYSNFDSLVE